MNNIVIVNMDRPGPDRGAFSPERMIDLSPTAFSYWDRDLQCRFANQACNDWFGVDPEILVGCALEDVVDILQLGPHFALVDAALQGERRSIVKSFHEGLARRDGFVQYVPDVRGHLVSGLLIQVSPMPPVSRLVRFSH